MNPFDKWYRDNEELREYLEGEFSQGKDIGSKDEMLYSDLMTRYSSENFVDKTLACLVVRMINKYNVRL